MLDLFGAAFPNQDGAAWVTLSLWPSQSVPPQIVWGAQIGDRWDWTGQQADICTRGRTVF